MQDFKAILKLDFFPWRISWHANWNAAWNFKIYADTKWRISFDKTRYALLERIPSWPFHLCLVYRFCFKFRLLSLLFKQKSFQWRKPQIWRMNTGVEFTCGILRHPLRCSEDLIRTSNGTPLQNLLQSMKVILPEYLVHENRRKCNKRRPPQRGFGFCTARGSWKRVGADETTSGAIGGDESRKRYTGKILETLRCFILQDLNTSFLSKQTLRENNTSFSPSLPHFDWLVTALRVFLWLLGSSCVRLCRVWLGLWIRAASRISFTCKNNFQQIHQKDWVQHYTAEQQVWWLHPVRFEIAESQRAPFSTTRSVLEATKLFRS